MAYQWAVMKCVTDPQDYAELRRDFAAYGLEWWTYYEVGHDDHVFSSKTWKDLDEAAVREGLLVKRRGSLLPVFGLGPHPDWQFP